MVLGRDVAAGLRWRLLEQENARLVDIWQLAVVFGADRYKALWVLFVLIVERLGALRLRAVVAAFTLLGKLLPVQTRLDRCLLGHNCLQSRPFARRLAHSRLGLKLAVLRIFSLTIKGVLDLLLELGC